MLLGSAFANIGACARVDTNQGVAAPEEVSRTVGNGLGTGLALGSGVGLGAAFSPYLLAVVVRLRLGLAALLPEIQVLGSLLPCKNEYEYHLAGFVGDW